MEILEFVDFDTRVYTVRQRLLEMVDDGALYKDIVRDAPVSMVCLRAFLRDNRRPWTKTLRRMERYIRRVDEGYFEEKS